MCHAQILSASIVRARKQHRCCLCARTITPGRRYRREAQVAEGDFAAHTYCRTCASEASALVAESSGDCYWFSGDERAELRTRPWRETLSRLRAEWRRLRGGALKRGEGA